MRNLFKHKKNNSGTQHGCAMGILYPYFKLHVAFNDSIRTPEWGSILS